MDRKRRSFKKNKVIVSGKGFVRISASSSRQHQSKDAPENDHENSFQIQEQDHIELEEPAIQLVDVESNLASHPSIKWQYVYLKEHYQITVKNQLCLHVINDFEIDQNMKVKVLKGFAVLFLFKVITKNGERAVSSCSICFSRELLGFFALNDHSQGEFDDGHLFGCRHSLAVTQRILAGAGYDCSFRDDIRSSQRILTELVPYTERLVPGWLHFQSTLHSKGKLCVYVTNDYTAHLFASQRQSSGTLRHYCFLCFKNFCHHSSTICHDIEQLVPDAIPVFKFPPKPLKNLVSKTPYPCNLQELILVRMYMDSDLKDVILKRRDQGSKWWNYHFAPIAKNDSYQEYNFSPPEETCCGKQMKQMNVSNQVHLFTASFFSFHRSAMNHRICEECKRTAPFDGREFGILNFNNLYLFDIRNWI